MQCNDCRYLGIIFSHLNGYNGIEKWGNCEYILPYHIDPKAIPLGIEHNCRTYEAKGSEGSSETHYMDMD